MKNGTLSGNKSNEKVGQRVTAKKLHSKLSERTCQRCLYDEDFISSNIDIGYTKSKEKNKKSGNN